MTIGFWILLGLLATTGIVLTIFCFMTETLYGVVSSLVTVVVCLAVSIFGHWYCNNTEVGIRALKDQQSNLGGGLLREVIITAEDGREIYYYKGSIDIETDPENKYILFETEEGMRHMIYYGATDTVLILEVEH